MRNSTLRGLRQWYRWSPISSHLSHVPQWERLNEHLLPIASQPSTSSFSVCGGQWAHLKLSGPGPPKQWCNTHRAYVTNPCWLFLTLKYKRWRTWEHSHKLYELQLHTSALTQWRVIRSVSNELKGLVHPKSKHAGEMCLFLNLTFQLPIQYDGMFITFSKEVLFPTDCVGLLVHQKDNKKLTTGLPKPCMWTNRFEWTDPLSSIKLGSSTNTCCKINSSWISVWEYFYSLSTDIIHYYFSVWRDTDTDHQQQHIHRCCRENRMVFSWGMS